MQTIESLTRRLDNLQHAYDAQQTESFRVKEEKGNLEMKVARLEEELRNLKAIINLPDPEK